MKSESKFVSYSTARDHVYPNNLNMPIISNWFQKLPQDIPYGMFRFQFIPWYGESLYKFEQVATGAPTENIYISAGSTPTTFHLTIVFYVGSQEYSIQKFSRSMDGEVAGPPPAAGFIINLRRLDTTPHRRHNYSGLVFLQR